MTAVTKDFNKHAQKLFRKLESKQAIIGVVAWACGPLYSGAKGLPGIGFDAQQKEDMVNQGVNYIDDVVMTK